MEKTYTVVSTRLETKEIITLELLDEESTPQTVLMTVHRMKIADFAALGKPNAGDKVKLKIEVVTVA